MKRNRALERKERYLRKCTSKIVNSQRQILDGLMRCAFEEGFVGEDFVSYKDDMYDIRFEVREDDTGTLRPCGKGIVSCVGENDVDFMKFTFNRNFKMTGYFVFQWGDNKGEIFYENDEPAGSAKMAQHVDFKLRIFETTFTPKKMLRHTGGMRRNRQGRNDGYSRS